MSPKLTALLAVSASLLPGLAFGYDILHPADVAKAVAQAKVTLDRALAASQAVGTPISAKYELDDHDDLMLSVYTAKFNGAQATDFREVFVDDTTGQIVNSKPITDTNDLKHASEQVTALGASTVKLAEFAARVAADNDGYVLAGIFPVMKDGAAAVEVHLMKGSTDKQVFVPMK